jgi:hypothetical protein
MGAQGQSVGEPDPARQGDAPARPGVPRWVKVLGIVAATLLLVMLIVMAATGGQHGPGRHQSSLGQAGAATLAANPRPASHQP